jgi:hypothetical protein
MSILMVAATIFAVYLGVWVQKKPDVVFLISEQVPVVDDEPPEKSQREVTQKVDIKNVGESEAKKIVLKLKVPVRRTRVEPFSSADKFEEHRPGTGYELIYPSLPPGASFSIVVRSQSGVPPTQIEVIHEAGAGREALSKGTSTSFAPFFAMLAFLIVYPFLMFNDIRSWKRQTYVGWRFSDSSPADIWLLVRPWYIKATEWEKVILEIAKDRIAREVIQFKSLRTSFAYRSLTDQQPTGLSQSAREQIQEIATRKVSAAIRAQISSALNLADLDAVLTVPWPEVVNQREGAELKQSIGRALRRVLTRWADSSDALMAALSIVQPTMYSQSEWIELQAEIRQEIKQQLRMLLRETSEPSTVLGSQAFAALSKTDQAEIEREVQLRTRNREAETLYVRLYELIRDALRGNLPTTKPDQIRDSDWDLLGKVKEAATSSRVDGAKAAELDRKIAENSAMATELERKALRVQRQLEAIANALEDPGNLIAIENLDTLFTSTNAARLQSLARRLGTA